MIDFNSSPSTWMHIDLNSCFATIEQQANPLLRGKPIAVAAYTTNRGCILAPSIEAKRFGVKTGMRVIDGKKICPHLIILPSDPPKYRFVNQKLQQLFSQYSPDISVRSIDEMLLDFSSINPNNYKSLHFIAHEIKERIKSEIGDWLTVSVGISTNPYLAKVAAGLHKPDGLDEINARNILAILSQHKLTDLPYIKDRNAARLQRVNIHTPVDFYFASTQQLKSAFESINGHYWYLRLHGYPIDQVEWQRKTIGHSFALPKSTNDITVLEPLLYQLVEKMGRRLRKNKLTTQGIHLTCNFSDGDFWHHGEKTTEPLYASSDLFITAQRLLRSVKPLKPVRILAVSCFELSENYNTQLTFFADELKKRSLITALDKINETWGDFSVMPATLLNMKHTVFDRISFGAVRDMKDVLQ